MKAASRPPLRVVVTDHAFGDVAQEQAAAASVGAAFREHRCRGEAETIAAVEGAGVVLNNFAPMTRNVQRALAPGAVVIRYGVGVDNVDLAAARELGVRVCNVPDYGVDEVADHAAAMALSLARRLNRFDAGIRNGGWKIAAIVPDLRSLRDTTAGLIGFGRIAQAFARRMAVFGCRVVACDPHVLGHVADDLGVALMPFDDVVAAADILSLHVPLLPATHHILGREAIARLPRGAIVINASRGGLVDEDALADALAAGRLSGAGLDVFESEPLAPGSPLRRAPNVILSPHAAFYSDASVKTLQRLASEEMLRALRAEPLRCALT